MRRNWYKGSHKENRNIRFGKDIIWNQMVRDYHQRIADLNAKDSINEYYDICEERLKKLTELYDDDYNEDDHRLEDDCR